MKLSSTLKKAQLEFKKLGTSSSISNRFEKEAKGNNLEISKYIKKINKSIIDKRENNKKVRKLF